MISERNRPNYYSKILYFLKFAPGGSNRHLSPISTHLEGHNIKQVHALNKRACWFLAIKFCGCDWGKLLKGVV